MDLNLSLNGEGFILLSTISYAFSSALIKNCLLYTSNRHMSVVADDVSRLCFRIGYSISVAAKSCRLSGYTVPEMRIYQMNKS